VVWLERSPIPELTKRQTEPMAHAQQPVQVAQRDTHKPWALPTLLLWLLWFGPQNSIGSGASNLQTRGREHRELILLGRWCSSRLGGRATLNENESIPDVILAATLGW